MNTNSCCPRSSRVRCVSWFFRQVWISKCYSLCSCLLGAICDHFEADCKTRSRYIRCQTMECRWVLSGPRLNFLLELRCPSFTATTLLTHYTLITFSSSLLEFSCTFRASPWVSDGLMSTSGFPYSSWIAFMFCSWPLELGFVTFL